MCFIFVCIDRYRCLFQLLFFYYFKIEKELLLVNTILGINERIVWFRTEMTDGEIIALNTPFC